MIMGEIGGSPNRAGLDRPFGLAGTVRHASPTRTMIGNGGAIGMAHVLTTRRSLGINTPRPHQPF